MVSRMALINYEDAKVGMRVILVEPDPGYDIGQTNPAAGTKYECLGYIHDLFGGEIEVQWDNGFHNIYKDGELLCITKKKPEGRCASIW